ncbi:MAG: hypothetical protein AAF533_09530 [Acidobacteriota bacterium]
MKLAKLTKFLDRLDEADHHYTLSSIKEGTITVGVSVPGERWEIEFMQDGDVEVEVFHADGDIRGFDATADLLKKKPG